MANHPPPETDPRQLAEAKALWHNFTAVGKYTIYVTAATLIGLALVFVKF